MLFVLLFGLCLFRFVGFLFHLGVWEGLRFVIVALPGLFSYLFFQSIHVKDMELFLRNGAFSPHFFFFFFFFFFFCNFCSVFLISVISDYKNNIKYDFFYIGIIFYKHPKRYSSTPYVKSVTKWSFILQNGARFPLVCNF